MRGALWSATVSLCNRVRVFHAFERKIALIRSEETPLQLRRLNLSDWGTYTQSFSGYLKFNPQRAPKKRTKRCLVSR